MEGQEGAEDHAQLFTANDLVEKPKILSLSSCRSTNGHIAFTVKDFSMAKNKSAINIFVNSSQDLKTTQYTRNDLGAACTQPVLLIDSSTNNSVQDMILFLKNGQIYCMPLYGGESVQVSNFPIPVESFKVFRDHDNQFRALLVMEVYASKSPAETAAYDEALVGKSSGMVFDQLMVRHWDNWGTYKKRNHLFLCSVAVTSSGLLEVSHEIFRDLMCGMETDCPGKPFGGEEEYSVSSDGSLIALACRRLSAEGSQPHDMAWSTDVSVFIAKVSECEEGAAGGGVGQSSLLRLISGEDWHGYNSQPSFSPDNKKIAFLSMARAGYESDKNQIRIFNVSSGKMVSVTEAIDLSFQSIEWGLEGSSVIYSTAQFRGSTRIFRLTLNEDVSENAAVGGDVASSPLLLSIDVMTGDENKTNPLLVPYCGPIKRASTALYFLESSLVAPPEIKMAILSSADASLFVPFDPQPLAEGEVPVRPTTSPSVVQIFVPVPELSNGDVLMPKVTSHYIRAGGDDLVHLWYLPPVAALGMPSATSALPDGSVPLVLIIHGGPQGAILNAWNYRWNLSFYASLGYGVVAVNFHGSTGYGQAFTDSIRGDWGGKPFQDCMAAVDYALGRFSYLDSSRVAALGASYGGYMINWINGHTDRFKCLVNHDGIFSLRSLYYTTEELFFPEWEFGLPWSDSEVYAKWSPDSFIAQWATPTLVIQGGKDYRVGEAEGLSTFTALQRKRIPSQMLFFPDENHWVLKPINSLKWHETVSQWLRRWLSK